MKSKNILNRFLYLFAIGFSIFILFFIVTCSWIGYDVKKQCYEAKRNYGGDCVDALSRILKDEKASFRKRNSAVWALGQIGDAKALPILQSYYTGEIPDREPLDQVISQYELKKAISLTSGGFNMGALVWRNTLLCHDCNL